MKIKRIRRPTPDECKAYANGGALYPLVRIVVCEHVELYVEGLYEGKDQPKYEIMAPEGKHFLEECHSLLCFDMKDLRERIQYTDLIPCTDACRSAKPLREFIQCLK